MSASQMLRCGRFAAAIAMGTMPFASGVSAADSAGGFPDLQVDPLRTRPPVLDAGVVLPGDGATWSCPAKLDLAMPVSLPDAVDAALCHDPQLRVTWAAIRVQAASVGQARAAYLPALSASVSGQRTGTRYSTLPAADTSVKSYSSYAALNWRLFDFGERDANRRAANDLLAAALASHDAALQKTLGEVVQAYFQALATQAGHRARTEAMQLAEQTLAAAQHREAHGATGRSDTLQSATAFARAQLAERRASGDADKAMASLVHALGIPAGTRLRLPQDGHTPVKQRIADLAQWLDAAKSHHPAIIAAKQQWEAARLKVMSARSQGLPTVDFGVSFYQNGYPNQAVQATRSKTTIVGLTLTVPLFEGFAKTYRIREAQAVAEQNDAQIANTERQVLGDIVRTHADAASALASLDSSAMLLESAQAALESSRNRYAHGVADILEVLNAQSALADAWQERIRTESDWRSARLRLMANAGLLGRGTIVDIDSGSAPSLSLAPSAVR